MCEFERHFFEAEIERLRDELEKTTTMLVRVAVHSVPGITELQLRRVAEYCREQGDHDAAASYIAAADYVRRHAAHSLLWIRADWPDDLMRLREEQARWIAERKAAEAADIEEVA